MFAIASPTRVYTGFVFVGRKKIVWSDRKSGIVGCVLFRDIDIANAVANEIIELEGFGDWEIIPSEDV